MTTRKLLEQAAQFAIDYVETVDSRPIHPPKEAVEALRELFEPFPDRRSDAEQVIGILQDFCNPALMGMTNSRFFGFVIGSAFPVSIAGNWMATAWDQNTAYFNATPATTVLEDIALRWLCDVFGFPEGTGGAFVTGATVANFCALAAARNSVLRDADWDVEADGLIGAPTITVITGEEAHPTLFKSLGMLGLGRNRVVKVPVDDQGRMQASELPSISGPTIVCAQAGNINSGAFDPVGDICDAAHGSGAWVHVDGAFGLWALASDKYKHLADGVTKADSWATDAHKWLNVNYDSGLAFVKDPSRLRAAMAITAEYLPPVGTERNPGEYTPELSRRARGVEVWAVLKHLGREGLTDLVDRLCARATQFGDGFKKAGYEVLNDVVLNQVTVTFGDAATNAKIIHGIQQDGTCWCGPTTWQGRDAMRISVSGYATSEEDVKRSLAVILRIAQEEGA